MTTTQKSSNPKRSKSWQVITLTILGVLLVITGFIGYPLIQQTQQNPLGTPQTPLAITPSQDQTAQQFLSPVQLPEALKEQGTIFMSMSDGDFKHLFIYSPLYLPLSRITNNQWDDITPSISPDGSHLMFSSRMNGYWNLYLINLATGHQTQLTDTPAYEGSPTWSPDNQWVAYESYADDNLEIYIQNAMDTSTAPIRLTEDDAADFSPAWSSAGRVIAFISSRTGNADIWLANLDSTDQRFTNLTQSQNATEQHPTWSPDGKKLAWVSDKNGINEIWVWDAGTTISLAHPLARGDWPAWSPDGSIIITAVQDPNQQYLAAYQVSDSTPILEPIAIPGRIHGMEWKHIATSDEGTTILPSTSYQQPPDLYTAIISTPPLYPAGRYSIVPLADLNTQFPYLHDAVDEAFTALRNAIGRQAGWDLLLSLQNAYIPLTSPPSPGISEDWLYTGRAFAVSTQPLQAGWMSIVREEYNGLTYWRVFIKVRYQDGSQGQPLNIPPWDMNARFSSDPVAYEQGGAIGGIPGGYWIDLTDLASQYGWQRLPAQRNWRTYYPAARFNQFVITSGLDWMAAMREIYPAEALITPTYIPTYTATPLTPTATPTSRYQRTPTPVIPTPTPTPTPTATIRPTYTPLPPTP